MHSPLAVLPLLLAVAMSPTPLAVSALLALGADGRRASAGYVIGWWCGASLVLGLSALGFSAALQASGSDTANRYRAYAELALGALLAVGGITMLLISRRPGARREEEAIESRLFRLVGDITPAKACLLGALMVIPSPRQLLFLVPAGTDLSTGTLPLTVALVLCGATIASLGVLTPAALLRRHDGSRILAHLRAWLLANGPTLGASIMTVVGIYIALRGWSGLSATS